MTQPCKVCRKQLEAGAAVCSECGNYQDWTRYLFRWKDVIVAVAALAPLWVGAKALHELVTHEPHADIRVVTLECDGQSFRVAASNVGDAAGLLGPARLKFITAQGLIQTQLEMKPAATEQIDPVLAPAATQVLTLRAYSQGAQTIIPYPRVGKPCNALAEFTLLGFDGARQVQSAACECPES